MMQFGEYDFRSFTFGFGSHSSRKDGMCFMEAVAYVAGEKHSDHPACAYPVISSFMRKWNDSMINDDRRRELLAPFIFRIPGTRKDSQINGSKKHPTDFNMTHSFASKLESALSFSSDADGSLLVSGIARHRQPVRESFQESR